MDNNEFPDDIEVNEVVKKYKPIGKKLTYADYADWENDGNRYELIDGVAYMMSAPSATHQRILIKFCRLFGDFLDDKPCEVFVAPFDVCLFGKGDDDENAVQPDVLVICDDKKLENDKYCNGAPDLVIEILSPSTSQFDRIVKMDKYMQAGVREYWITDPDDKSITVHLLENGKYVIRKYSESDIISVNILEGCKIKLNDIF